MKSVCITTVGPVDSSVAASVEEAVRTTLELPAMRLPGLPEAAFAWDSNRQQYSSSLILKRLVETRPADALRLVALTESDLFIPMLSFIYGQAQVDGTAAIVSLSRLRQEFYGLPADPELLCERVRKEILHELGHTFGLVHCPDRGCVMTLATNIRQLDLKTSGYCPDCAILVKERIRRDALEGIEEA